MPDSGTDKRLILVVEDDELVASILDIVLELRGYALAGPVATLEAAMLLLETTKPDLALIDFRLARGTTAGLLPALHHLKVPTCVFTGVAPGSLPVAYAHCMVLQKPFRLNELIGVVTALESSIPTNPN